jgi:hypothetical protein
MKTAYHIVTGSMVMEDTDANWAVAAHPDEWSFTPWAPDKRKAFVDAAVSDHKKEVVAAKEMGVDPPPPPAVTQVRPLYPDEQAALDKHNKDFAAAQKRLEVADKEDADAKAKAAQIAADREMVKRPPPVVDWDRPPPAKDTPPPVKSVEPAKPVVPPVVAPPVTPFAPRSDMTPVPPPATPPA